jgi:serine/threonine protein kinase/Flp pilus assembly protein TadD
MPDRIDETRPYRVLTKGTIIGRYRIVDWIGAGGMGEVYKARDQTLQRDVALKFLSQLQLEDGDARERFRVEAIASAALDHQSIVTVYETGEYEGRPFIAMQYIRGKSLRDLLDARGRLDFGESIDLALKLCDALRLAHKSDILHLDVKPGNVLIDPDGNPRLCDFGIASVAALKGKSDKDGDVSFGTLGYAAPEQITQGKSDARTDIFAIGVVLYESISGKNPFKRENRALTLKAIISEDPEPLTSIDPRLPSEVDDVIARALAKTPDERYGSMEALLADLTRLRELYSGKVTGRLTRTPAFRASIITAAIALILAIAFTWPYVPNLIKQLVQSELPDSMHLSVLPFRTIGKIPTGQEYIDGMLETLTSRLTQLEQFREPLWVVPASEVRRQGVDTPAEARKAFGATLVVTGSIQFLSNRVRLTLDLVDARVDRNLRSTVVDHPITDLVTLQDAAVGELIRLLELELNPVQLSAVTAVGTDNRRAHEDYLRGVGYLIRRKESNVLDSALHYLNSATESDPDYALAHAALGEAYWWKYNAVKSEAYVDSAFASATKAADLANNHASVMITLGTIHSGTGQYRQAIEDFKRAISIDPVNHRAYSGLAEAYEAIGKLDSAELTYRQVTLLKPEYFTGNLDLGFFYASHGRTDEAIAQARQLDSIQPTGFTAWNNLGALYYFAGNLDEARKRWERSLEIESNYGALSNLGSYYYLNGEYENAVKYFEAALKLSDTDYVVWGNLAMAKSILNRPKKEVRETYLTAIERAKQVTDINPKDPDTYAALSEYLATIDDTVLSMKYLDRAFELAPQDPDIMLTAAQVNAELGRREEAVAWLRSALDNGYPRESIKGLPELGPLLQDIDESGNQ